jgi:glycosyltransferase involved in cell wall biosynthesis
VVTRVVPVLLREPDGRKIEGSMTVAAGFEVAGPLISCVMVSRGVIYPAVFAIECYRRQTYANRELIVVSAAADTSLRDMIAEIGDPTIKFVSVAPASLGDLRNISIAQSSGELICQWDDDDLSAPDRLELQTAALAQSYSTACYFGAITLWWPARRWLAKSEARGWENTMLVKREAIPIYAAENLAEDTRVAQMLERHHRSCLILSPDSYFYVHHGLNACGEAHFERRFEAGSLVIPEVDYNRELAAAGARVPVADYAGFLARGGV